MRQSQRERHTQLEKCHSLSGIKGLPPNVINHELMYFFYVFLSDRQLMDVQRLRPTEFIEVSYHSSAI